MFVCLNLDQYAVKIKYICTQCSLSNHLYWDKFSFMPYLGISLRSLSACTWRYFKERALSSGLVQLHLLPGLVQLHMVELTKAEVLPKWGCNST